MQTETSLDPVEEDQVPAGQLLHELEEVAAFDVDQVPAGQLMQAEPEDQVPATQLIQEVLSEAPLNEKVPWLHFRH
jgi:hypothetical protein